MLLTPEILTILILNSIFLIFGLLAFILSFTIYKKWNINSTTNLQYKLEKRGYLTATIIKYIFLIKVPLLLFFIFTLDKLSVSITGAMCAAGVVDATSYGIYLLILKIINIYLFGFWLSFHYADIKHENLPYTQVKFGIFLVLFVLLTLEIIIETVMFSSIDINKMVSCCGTLYSSTSGSYISSIFQISSPVLLSLFYGTFLTLGLLYYFKQKQLFSIVNILFLIISLITLISFFGTYIYELPTHHCPFCFLQRDYNYIGYLIYTLLFIGTFYGVMLGFRDDKGTKDYKVSMIFNTLYVLLVSAYPISYYIKNGVWL